MTGAAMGAEGMTSTTAARYSLFLLGTGSAAVYVASSALITGSLAKGTPPRTSLAVHSRNRAEVQRIQAMEAANAAAARTLAEAHSRLAAARAAVLTLRQQLQSLQGQSTTHGARLSLPAAVAALPPAPPAYVPPPVAMPPVSTRTGAS